MGKRGTIGVPLFRFCKEVKKTSNYEEPRGENTLEWPYLVNYGKGNEARVDVLIIGGGLAGATRL